ncbi:hypothetical protein KK425_19235 [Clostridioides difficile]|nr:hypothetical protein [Clostridioides difficile]
MVLKNDFDIKNHTVYITVWQNSNKPHSIIHVALYYDDKIKTLTTITIANIDTILKNHNPKGLVSML